MTGIRHVLPTLGRKVEMWKDNELHSWYRKDLLWRRRMVSPQSIYIYFFIVDIILERKRKLHSTKCFLYVVKTNSLEQIFLFQG